MEYNSQAGSSSYVEWGAVIAGTVLALALSSVLLQFGAVLGVADLAYLRDGVDITPARIFLAGLFVLIVQILSSMIGGYVAGRMRRPMADATEHEREIRDGMHGVLVWATSTIAVMIAAAAVSAIAAFHPETSDQIERAQDVMDRQHKIAIILAFSAATTSLVSGVASYVTAVFGGDHRDKQTDFSRHLSFRVITR